MKTISLATSYRLLEASSAAIRGDSTLVFPVLSCLTGEDDNEWLLLEWDEDGLCFSIRFRERENRDVRAAGSSLFLVDVDGNEEQVTLLCPWNMEEHTPPGDEEGRGL